MGCDRSRRDTLRLVSSLSAVGVAGCLTNPPAYGDDGNTTDPSVETTTKTASTATTTDSDQNLSFAVTILEPFTEDHPGRVRIALTNSHTEPVAMNVARGIEGPMSVIEGTRKEGDDTLIMLADNPEQTRETPPGAPCRSGENAIPETPTDGCWKPACEIAWVTSHYAISIPAGQTLAWEYVLLDGDNETCLPAGTYVFEETTPITVLRTTATPETTPPGGWSQLLTKRVLLTLSTDGTLTADAEFNIKPYGTENAESSPNPTPVPGTTTPTK